MVFRSGPVTVQVPATSANLGPGFDCLGVALDLHDTLRGEVVESGLQVRAEGEGAGDLPTDGTHLVVRAMADVFEAVGLEPPGLRVHCHNRVPQSRGLGSSSAAIVGGLVLGRALLSDPDALSDQRLLELATVREGHPDNVAPALLGGLVIAGQQDGEVWACRAPLASGLAVTVLVPADGLSTQEARSLLPRELPHGRAVANTGRAALLVAALAGCTDQLLRATEDFVHQDYREPAMPASVALVRRLREAGVPASVSGAGPSVLAWRVGAAAGPVDVPDGWTRLDLDVDLAGARVLSP